MAREIPETQMDRLPKWAQKHIRWLENHIDSLEAEKRQWFENKNGNVQLVYFNGVGAGLGDEAHQRLPDHQAVRFNFPKMPERMGPSYVEASLASDGSHVLIRTSDYMLVRPEVSNSIRVYPQGDRFDD